MTGADSPEAMLRPYMDGLTTVLALVVFALTAMGGLVIALFGKRYELIPALGFTFIGMMIVVVGAGITMNLVAWGTANG